MASSQNTPAASSLTWRYPFPAKDGKEISDPQTFYSALGAMSDGFFPLGVNGFPHGGVHFGAASASRLDQSKGVRAIADGEIVAFKIDDAYPHLHFTQTRHWAWYSTGFVLVRHTMTMPPAPGSTGTQPADETLTFFSLYMHLADWNTYLSDGKLVRPGWWPGVDAFRIGSKDTQSGGGAGGAFVYAAPGAGRTRNQYSAGQHVGFLPEGSEVTIGETRGQWGHIKTITAGTMISAQSGAYFGQEDGPQAPWVVADGEAASSTPIMSEGDWGWINLHDQQAVKEPAAGVGAVCHLPEDKLIHVSAGTSLGQLGEYVDYETSTPLPPIPSRQLAHLEVFADDTLKAFIEKGRARDTKLPPGDKTILVIQAGARLVAKPTDADLNLGTGVQFAKLTLTATSPKTGPWIQVQPWINSPSAQAREYQAPVWIARSGLSRLDSPNGLAAWKSFPLQLNQVGSPVNADLVTYPSAELNSLGDGNVAIDDKGVTWWRLEVGTGSGQTALGWVCGAKQSDGSGAHPGTQWKSPWAWPGFDIVDATGINLSDAFKRNLSITGSASPKEQKAFAPSTEVVGKSALLLKLEQTVSRHSSGGAKDEQAKDRGVVTAVKLRQALTRRWLANELGHVILKYESEWGGGISRWEALTPLMRNAAENWTCELERIKKLQWWDAVKGQVERFPSSPVVNHVNPVALIGNFFRDGFCFTLEIVRHIFPTATIATLQVVVDELNSHMEMFKLDTPLRREHFLAQVRREAGPSMAVHDGESLNYPPSRLIQKFSYFQRHPAEAEQYGRTSAHPADQEAIANRAYGGRNGNVQDDDGWKYRGRGLIQITGRTQYTKFSDWHRRNSQGWPNEANLDFLQNFQLVGQIKYAVRSAVAYWLDNEMYQVADQGASADTVDKITKLINPGLFSHRPGQPINAENTADIADRQNNFFAIHNWQGLR